MDLPNLLIWWLHFLLGVLGWFTGLHIFPEELGIGSQDTFTKAAAKDGGASLTARICDTPRTSIHSFSNTGRLDGSILLPSDGHNYGQARDQYASVTYAQTLSPSAIILVASEADVQAAVQFAAECNYSVSIRSGGHSYLGTSSCDSTKGHCLQIDVSGLNHRVMQQENQQIRLGPGNRLEDAAEFLKDHGRFLPTGECPSVALGGHMQTGGFGLFTRHFGPFADSVEAFRIVLADGQLHEIVTPVLGETSQQNDDIFYAVLGGASGSWGVVTEMILNTIHDDDYFSVYWKLAYWWDTEEDTNGIVNMMRTWTKMAKERKDDWRWAAHWSVVGAKNVPTMGNRIQLEGSWVAPKEQAHEYDFDFFQSIDDACTNCKRFRYINVTEPLSQIWRYRYLRTLINKGTGREFPVPYTRSMQQTQEFPSPDGIEGITRSMAKLLPSRTSPYFTIHQLTTLRAAKPNRALPWPNDAFSITLDYFYVPPSDWFIDHNKRALDFGKDIRDNANGDDHRMYWAAYDNPHIHKDWPKYFDSEEKFQRLQGIKQRYDPTNLFQNKMSIPLPGGQVAGHNATTQEIPGADCDGNSAPGQAECSLTSQQHGACVVSGEAMLS